MTDPHPPTLVPKPSRDAVARRVGLAILLAGLGVWVGGQAWREIVRLAWIDEQSSHGLAVPLAIFLLVAARRSRLESVRIEPHWCGPVLVAIGTGAWAIGWPLDVQIGWHGGALLMALGGWVTMTGLDPIRKFAPAYVALIFLLPTPAALRTPITVPLQDVTATLARHACELLGMGVTQAGRMLCVNGREVTVAEACSGMRMVFTLLLACFLCVYSLPLREGVRWIVLLSTPAIAIAANVVRLVPTLWAYGRFPPGIADPIHAASGWVMVVGAYLAVEGALRLLKGMGVPIYRTRANVREERSARGPRHAVACLLATLLVFAGGTANRIRLGASPDAAPFLAGVREAALRVSGDVPGMIVNAGPLPRQAFELLHPNVLQTRTYTDLIDGVAFTVLLVHCGDVNDMGAHHPPACYPGTGLQVTDTDPMPLACGERSLDGVEYLLEPARIDDRPPLRIWNCMFLPGGVSMYEPGKLRRQARAGNQRYYGSGQIQVIVPASLPEGRRRTIYRDALRIYAPVVGEMMGDPGPSGTRQNENGG